MVEAALAAAAAWLDLAQTRRGGSSVFASLSVSVRQSSMTVVKWIRLRGKTGRKICHDKKINKFGQQILLRPYLRMYIV
jgi:hypothetical protein